MHNSLDCNKSSLVPYIKDSVTKEDFVIVAGGIENANDGQLNSTEILKNGNWEGGTLMQFYDSRPPVL